MVNTEQAALKDFGVFVSPMPITSIYVKLEDVSLKREQLESYVREQVKNSNGEGVDLAALGQKLHKSPQ